MSRIITCYSCSKELTVLNSKVSGKKVLCYECNEMDDCQKMNEDRFKFRAGYEHPNGKIVLQESDEYYSDWFWKTNRKAPYDTPIMQSTGLRDKNGALIFEGDILHIQNHYGDDEDFIGKVEFNTETCAFEVEDDLETYILGEFDCEDCKIIGNAYEHPELLEKGND